MARRPASDREVFWRQLVARQASSDLTVGELCRRAEVSTASFYAWRRRLQSLGGTTPSFAAEPSSLVPVRVGAALRGREVGGPIVVELTIKLAGNSAQAVRVSIPPDCDEASIGRVLRAIVSAGDGRDATAGEISTC